MFKRNWNLYALLHVHHYADVIMNHLINSRASRNVIKIALLMIPKKCFLNLHTQGKQLVTL